jgi:hypothetical protein
MSPSPAELPAIAKAALEKARKKADAAAKLKAETDDYNARLLQMPAVLTAKAKAAQMKAVKAQKKADAVVKRKADTDDINAHLLQSPAVKTAKAKAAQMLPTLKADAAAVARLKKKASKERIRLSQLGADRGPRGALPTYFPRDASFAHHELQRDPLASMAAVCAMSGRVLFDDWRHALTAGIELSSEDETALVDAIAREALVTDADVYRLHAAYGKAMDPGTPLQECASCGIAEYGFDDELPYNDRTLADCALGLTSVDLQTRIARTPERWRPAYTVIMNRGVPYALYDDLVSVNGVKGADTSDADPKSVTFPLCKLCNVKDGAGMWNSERVENYKTIHFAPAFSFAGPFAAIKCDWGRPERVGLKPPSLVCKLLLAPTRVLQVCNGDKGALLRGFLATTCSFLAVQHPASFIGPLLRRREGPRRCVCTGKGRLSPARLCCSERRVRRGLHRRYIFVSKSKQRRGSPRASSHTSS